MMVKLLINPNKECYMNNDFEKQLNELILHSTYGYEDEWLITHIKKLIDSSGPKRALEYAHSSFATIYEISLLVKGGLQGVDMKLLLNYLNSENEDNRYDAAIALAIYNHPKGIETIKTFINNTQKSQAYEPKLDILPDLKFIRNSEGRALENLILKRFPGTRIE